MTKVVDTIPPSPSSRSTRWATRIDVFWFADDMGFQDLPYMKPEMYRELVKPYLDRFLERSAPRPMR